MLLEGKNALITGAARGIGAAMVEVFAREGANVWAFARTPDARFEARLAMAAGKYGVWIKPVYCELTDTAALKEAFRQVMADKQPLNVLVNNAGIMGEDRMFQMTGEEDMHRIMDVNFFAMVEVSRLATRLVAQKQMRRGGQHRQRRRHRGRQPPGLFRLQGGGDRRHEEDGARAHQRGHPRQRPGSRLYRHGSR